MATTQPSSGGETRTPPPRPSSQPTRAATRSPKPTALPATGTGRRRRRNPRGRYPTPPPIIETDIPLPLRILATQTWAEYDDAHEAVIHACQDAGFGVSKDRSVADPRTKVYKRVNYSCWRGSRRDKIPIPDSQRKRKRTTQNVDCPWNGSLKRYAFDGLWHFVYIAGRMHHNHEMTDRTEDINCVKRQLKKAIATNKVVRRPIAQAGEIPTTGLRMDELAPSIKKFLEDHPDLRITGDGNLHRERRRHLEVFGWQALEVARRAPIGRVIYAGVRTRHGTVICRLFYPQVFFHTAPADGSQKLPALIYFHGGAFGLGSVDEYENALRLLSEAAAVIVVGVEFHLAPEHPYPTQLDEYEDVLEWASGSEGAYYGIDADRIIGGGDSSGATFTTAVCLRIKDDNKKPLKAQILISPLTKLPYDTPAASENNTGYYLEGNAVLSFANHYARRAPDKSHPLTDRYLMPGYQDAPKLGGLPHAAIYTCGFDPTRDVGLDYASRMRSGGGRVEWYHYPALTHGFLQMAAWSPEAMKATLDVASAIKKLAYF